MLAPDEVPDVKVLKMVKRAEVTLELETGTQIDYSNCTDGEKEFITILAAIYIICHLTGRSAVDLNYSIGDENVSVACNVPPLSILQARLGEFSSDAFLLLQIESIELKITRQRLSKSDQ